MLLGFCRERMSMNLTTSHCTKYLSIRMSPCKKILLKVYNETRGNVYSHRLSYLVSNVKVRIGGDFFYGKSENQNYLKGL